MPRRNQQIFEFDCEASFFDFRIFNKDPLNMKIPIMLVGLKFGSDDMHG